MSIKRALIHLLTLVVGFSITLPYFYDRAAVDERVTDMVGAGSADKAILMLLFGMVVLFFFALRATALLSSPASAWRDTGNMNNIKGLFSYRDSRLKGMTNADGSVLMRETQLLDAMSMYPEGSEAHRVAQYTDSRLAGMTYEQGLQFMRSSTK